jgi:hypothetical protein
MSLPVGKQGLRTGVNVIKNYLPLTLQTNKLEGFVNRKLLGPIRF